MTTTAKLMNIRIKAGATGVFFATSEDDPTFFLTATSASQLWAAIPHALEDLFRARDLDYVAMETDKGRFGDKEWVMIPRSSPVFRENARQEACEAA